MWLVTNKPLHSLEKQNASPLFNFYADQEYYSDNLSGIIILTEGYVVPRIGISNKLPAPEFIHEMYKEHGTDFIQQVKGNFTILIIDKSNFFLFSDRFAIKKFFTWQSGQDYYLSNDLGTITSSINSKPSKENIAIYALTYHFIGGTTLFEDIYHNSPAEYIIFSEGSLERKVYWDAKRLTTLEKKRITPEEIASLLQRITDSYLDYSLTNKISHSLTAGVDSRLLFSLLKSKQIDLHTYTYGNPASIDAVIAKTIAERYRVPHEIHSIEFSSENIANLTKETVANGQSLCSLHRAHRYMAIGYEAAYGESMFLGTMGGEFIKSANHDDYIISDFVYEFSQKHDIKTLDKYLLQKFIRAGSVNKEILLDFFRSQEWCKNPELVDLFGLVEIAASLHHGQNDQLYSSYFKQVFTPFIDIDYLEALFSSSYHFIVKKEQRCKLKQRLDNHRFGADIQKILEPGLLQVPYNSGIIAAEYLKSPLVATFSSRIRKKRWDFPANFPLRNFMKDYVEGYLTHIQRNPGIINEVFDIVGLLKELKTKRYHHSTEAYWLKYTSPIQMHLIMECFL